MHKLNSIKIPTLLVNEEICRTNIRKMVEKCKTGNSVIRPHFKTHQSVKIGEWFREEGVDCISVSSVTMAQYFARPGWKDVTIAFPLNPLEISAIDELARTIQLNLITDNPESIQQIADLTATAGMFVKIDTGYQRYGIPASNIGRIDELVKSISSHPQLEFKGFLAHEGHSYSAHSKGEIIQIHEESQKQLTGLQGHSLFKSMDPIVSMGSTPTCAILQSFEGAQEIRPGNFVFFDLFQHHLGICEKREIGLCMACPVVGKYPDRHELIIHGGGVHFSKDNISINGIQCFGEVVELNSSGWETQSFGSVYNLSQEHGKVRIDDSQFFDTIEIGDLIGVLPIHSCLTANLQSSYLSTTNEVISTIHS